MLSLEQRKYILEQPNQFIYNTVLFQKYHVQGYWQSSSIPVFSKIHDKLFLSELKSAISAWNNTHAIHLYLISNQNKNCISIDYLDQNNSELKSDTNISNQLSQLLDTVWLYQGVSRYFDSHWQYRIADTSLKQDSDLKISNAKITINHDLFLSLNLNQQKATLIHELGRAIGLGYYAKLNSIDPCTELESDKNTDIMQCRLPLSSAEIKSDCINCLLQLYQDNTITDVKSDIKFNLFAQYWTLDKIEQNNYCLDNEYDIPEFNSVKIGRIADYVGKYVVSLYSNKIFHTAVQQLLSPLDYVVLDKLHKSDLNSADLKDIAEEYSEEWINKITNSSDFKISTKIDYRDAIDKNNVSDINNRLNMFEKQYNGKAIIQESIWNKNRYLRSRDIPVYFKIRKGQNKKYEKYIASALKSAIEIWNKTGVFHFHLTDNKSEKGICRVYFRRYNGNDWAKTTYRFKEIPKGKMPWITINAENFIGNYEQNKALEKKHLVHVLMHELGHAIGLDHTNIFYDLMYPYSDMKDFVDKANKPNPTDISSDDKYLIKNILYKSNKKDHRLVWYAW